MPNFSLKDQVVFEAARQFATPFHLYSERGIRQTARALKDAFGEIEDFREYFAAVSYTHLDVYKRQGVSDGGL